jgi:hypothetical protein
MKRIIIAFALGIVAWGTQAQESKFFQASLTPDIALQDRDTEIRGISLNIWGENPQHGFTLGFVNGSTGKSGGFTMGLYNYSEDYNGVQFGMVNYSKGVYVGWQDGWVNISKEFHGLQTGIVNYTESLHGVQLGLVNIVKENPWFTEFPSKLAKGFVFVNWSF